MSNRMRRYKINSNQTLWDRFSSVIMDCSNSSHNISILKVTDLNHTALLCKFWAAFTRLDWDVSVATLKHQIWWRLLKSIIWSFVAVALHYIKSSKCPFFEVYLHSVSGIGSVLNSDDWASLYRQLPCQQRLHKTIGIKHRTIYY